MKCFFSAIKNACLAVTMMLTSTYAILAQQQQMEFQSVQSVEFASLNLNDLPQVDFGFMPAVAEPRRVPSLTPDETNEIKDTLRQLHAALAAERGDNLLAQVWDFESGTITRNKRFAQPEVLKFDPQGEISLRDWLKSQLSVEVVKSWKDAQIHPISENDETVTISLRDQSTTLKQVTLRPVGNHFQIISIVFISSLC